MHNGYNKMVKARKHKDINRRMTVIKKKQPFSRNILKSFIRESTYRSSPWVLHDNLARKHGISTDLPVDLRGQVSFQDGLIICNKKRRKNEDDKTINGVIILLQFS